MHLIVATVLTVYGIETLVIFYEFYTKHFAVATVLTVYGIETCIKAPQTKKNHIVATVLTVYGMRRRV